MSASSKADQIVDVITEVHDRIRKQFDEFEALSEDDRDGRKTLWSKIKDTLTEHHDAEEETLFNALVQTNSNARHESLHAVSEHGEHKKLLEQMADLNFDADDWQDKFAELKHDVLHHLEEEEEDVLPIAREVLDAETSRKLAQEYWSKAA